MPTAILKSEAQAALDELVAEGLLPFRLEARQIVPGEDSQYTVRFHDSRLRSVAVKLEAGESFKELVRAAVIDRVRALGGYPTGFGTRRAA